MVFEGHKAQFLPKIGRWCHIGRGNRARAGRLFVSAFNHKWVWAVIKSNAFFFFQWIHSKVFDRQCHIGLG